jgi:hypothetical protein
MPFKAFHDEVGINSAEGVAGGFKDGTRTVERSAEDMAKTALYTLEVAVRYFQVCFRRHGHGPDDQACARPFRSGDRC